jgi:DnaJ-class molecular chaperone
VNITESYKLLGLPETATPDELKAKYRELTKQHHPDMAGGNAVQFQAVQNAYKKVVDHMRAANCEDCRGRGKVLRARGFSSMHETCKACGGSGRRWR